ncbi:MAG: LVIVD repeat-containing protein [Actinomycetota bacterium]
MRLWRSASLLMVVVLGVSIAAVSAGPRSSHRLIGALEVSRKAGLGRLELHGKLAAVLQRDEGAVALVDVSNPSKMKVLGRYDDDIPDSFDGDLAFSDDGKWLFYGRQTHQFSKDGIHVLDVTDPKSPSFVHYQPQGGTLRVAYFKGAGGEWAFSLDAIHGLVVNRFVPEAGALVPVHVNALPALKVGGPASGGLFIERKDPILGVPLLYAATGSTGVEIFDISDPAAPTLLGSWNGTGLAEVEVVATKKRRTIYGATEYWFDKSLEPRVMELDATDPGAIELEDVGGLACAPDDRWRAQGMALGGTDLYAAYSNAGLVVFEGADLPRELLPLPDVAGNEAAAMTVAPYLFDVEIKGPRVYATDAATGMLMVWAGGGSKLPEHPHGCS